MAPVCTPLRPQPIGRPGAPGVDLHTHSLDFPVFFGHQIGVCLKRRGYLHRFDRDDLDIFVLLPGSFHSLLLGK